MKRRIDRAEKPEGEGMSEVPTPNQGPVPSAHSLGGVDQIEVAIGFHEK